MLTCGQQSVVHCYAYCRFAVDVAVAVAADVAAVVAAAAAAAAPASRLSCAAQSALGNNKSAVGAGYKTDEPQPVVISHHLTVLRFSYRLSQKSSANQQCPP